MRIDGLMALSDRCRRLRGNREIAVWVLQDPIREALE